MEQVRDTNPEYDSVDASQGTKASDSHSPKNQVKGNCHNISECHIRKSKHLKGQLRPRQKRNVITFARRMYSGPTILALGRHRT